MGGRSPDRRREVQEGDLHKPRIVLRHHRLKQMGRSRSRRQLAEHVRLRRCDELSDGIRLARHRRLPWRVVSRHAALPLLQGRKLPGKGRRFSIAHCGHAPRLPRQQQQRHAEQLRRPPDGRERVRREVCGICLFQQGCGRRFDFGLSVLLHQRHRLLRRRKRDGPGERDVGNGADGRAGERRQRAGRARTHGRHHRRRAAEQRQRTRLHRGDPGRRGSRRRAASVA